MTQQTCQSECLLLCQSEKTIHTFSPSRTAIVKLLIEIQWHWFCFLQTSSVRLQHRMYLLVESVWHTNPNVTKNSYFTSAHTISLKSILFCSLEGQCFVDLTLSHSGAIIMLMEREKNPTKAVIHQLWRKMQQNCSICVHSSSSLPVECWYFLAGCVISQSCSSALSERRTEDGLCFRTSHMFF